MTNILAISFIQKRIAVGVMAIAMFFGMLAFATPAHAFIATPPTTTPTPSSLSTTAQLQAMINSLMKQVAALQAQIKARQSGFSGSTSSQITRNFGIGATGTQVRTLNSCLSDLGFFKGTVNNAYSAATERAVKAFQAKEGIVSSGNAWSTGYGYVGPKTRRAINAACVSTMTPGRPGISEAKLTASPRSGEAPLTVKFKSNYGDSSGRANVPDAGRVVIDFGDGSDQVDVRCDMDPSQFGPTGSQPISGLCDTKAVFTHKYKKEGTYKAKLMRVGMFTPTPETSSQVLDTVKVTVGAVDEPVADDDDDTTNDNSEIGDVTYEVDGYDVAVTYTAQICSASRSVKWGDGGVQALAIDPAPGIDCTDDSLTAQPTAKHTYDEPGEYTINLQFGDTNWTKTITIEGDEDTGDDDVTTDDPTGEKVYARIVVEQSAKAKGTYHGKQAKLANGNIKKNGEWFWLTNDGEFVKDSVGPRSVAGAETFPGLTVSRSGDGEFRIGLIGNNKDGSMTEFSEGYIEIKGPAKIVEVGKVKTEKHADISSEHNTKLVVDYITKASKTRANFGLAVSTGVDILVVKVEPTGEVLGASTSVDEIAASLDTLDSALAALEAKVLPKSQVLGASTMSTNDRFATVLDTLDTALDQVEASL